MNIVSTVIIELKMNSEKVIHFESMNSDRNYMIFDLSNLLII